MEVGSGVTSEFFFVPGSFRVGSRLPVPGRRCGQSLKFRCRSFRGGDGERDLESAKEQKEERVGVLEMLRYGLKNWDSVYEDSVAKVEEVLSAVAVQIGRNIMTMMSTGVILAVGFQLSGGDPQMDTSIWYSWLGGVIIGTMIGANMVLEEHCKAGPRNVVVTGSTRGLGKALAREFLLSGDRVIVASRSPESVDLTVIVLEENLEEMRATGGSGKTSLARAKVVCISCDVCEPEDVQNLSNFAVAQLGSIDIWINNAGINKGFRPLLQFTDDDIQQIVLTNLVG